VRLEAARAQAASPRKLRIQATERNRIIPNYLKELGLDGP